MNADGSDETRLTNNSVYDDSPKFKSDGSRIIYTSVVDLYRQIFSMNPDGSDKVQLTRSSSDKVRPVWAPDSSSIAFEASKTIYSPSPHPSQNVLPSDQNKVFQIFTMDPDGENEFQLTTETSRACDPIWSLDSKYILYVYRSCFYRNNKNERLSSVLVVALLFRTPYTYLTMGRIIKAILNKFADWLNGLIISQIILIVLEIVNRIGTTNQLLVFYNLQEAYNAIGILTDILWWADFIMLVFAVFWHWFRNKFPDISY